MQPPHLDKHMLNWWGGKGRSLPAQCSLPLPERKCLGLPVRPGFPGHFVELEKSCAKGAIFMPSWLGRGTRPKICNNTHRVGSQFVPLARMVFMRSSIGMATVAVRDPEVPVNAPESPVPRGEGIPPQTTAQSWRSLPLV